MKNTFAILGISLLLISCGAKQATLADNLPKDISQKPNNDYAQMGEREILNALISEIEAKISETPCSDPADWRILPIGAKPCGGPSSYIAIPIALEEELIPKITEFTRLASEFNRKHKLISDCAIVPEPAGVRCEDGKAILIGSRQGSVETQ